MTDDDAHEMEAPRNPSVRKALKWSVLSQFLSRAGTFALGVVLARLLVPEEYGVYTVALGLYTILLTVDDLGLRSGLVRWPGPFQQAAPTARTMSTVIGIVTYAVSFLLAPVIADVTNTPDATGVIRLVCVGLLIDAGIHIVPGAALQRNFQQGRWAVTELVSLVVDFIVTVVLAVHGLGPWALAWGTLAGQLTKSLLAQWLAGVGPRFGYDRPLARDLMRVSAPYAVASLAGAALLNVDYLVVGNVLGSVAVGVYLIAFNVSNWPISLVGTAVRAVAIPGFSRLRGHPEQMGRAIRSGLALLIAGALPFVTMLISIPDGVIGALYGEEWTPGASALRYLGLMSIVRLVAGLVDDMLFALGKSHWILAKNLLWLVLLIPAVAIGAKTDGLRGVGIAQAIVAFVVIVPVLIAMMAKVGTWSSELTRTVVALLPGAVLACVAGLVLHETLDGPKLLVVTIVGLVELVIFCACALPSRARLRPGQVMNVADAT